MTGSLLNQALVVFFLGSESDSELLELLLRGFVAGMVSEAAGHGEAKASDLALKHLRFTMNILLRL